MKKRAIFFILITFLLVLTICWAAAQTSGKESTDGWDKYFEESGEKLLFEKYTTSIAAGEKGSFIFAVKNYDDLFPNCVGKFNLLHVFCRNKIQIEGQKEENILVTGAVQPDIAEGEIGYGKIIATTFPSSRTGTYACTIKIGNKVVDESCREMRTKEYAVQHFFITVTDENRSAFLRFFLWIKHLFYL